MVYFKAITAKLVSHFLRTFLLYGTCATVPYIFDNLLFLSEIQCVTADAYRNRSAFRLSPPTIDPIVVNLGTFITYSCNNGMYLPSYATTLDVKCLPSFEFDYQDDANIYKCRELCENDPPPALAESTSTVPGKDRLDLGWWEDTIIE